MALTDAEFKAQKRRIKKLAKKWVRPIGLGWWRIDIDYVREKGDNADDNFETVASCRARWQYRKALLTFHLASCAAMSDDVLEETFVHECVHIFLNELKTPQDTQEMADTMHHHEERVCSDITNAILWARKAGFRDGRKAGAA